MKIGYIGLGKMGKNMTLRLLEHGIEVVAYNRSSEPVEKVAQKGAIPAYSYEELFSQLPETGRVIWLMVPHTAVDDVLQDISTHLQEGDIVIDGGNSNYKESVRRGTALKEKGIHYVDVGVSGGPDGARNGACLMIGGEKDAYTKIEPVCQAAAAPQSYQYLGRLGAGHFAKMVHNGIEYGMMQAIGEGMEIIKESEFDFDVEQVARIYNSHSVIESRLVGWLYEGYTKHGKNLEEISGEVSHSGEGQWTVETAKEMHINTPIIVGSLQFRKDSQGNPSYTGKVVSLLRTMFGGHDVSKK